MRPEPIASVADLLSDDWRAARMGLVGDGWAAGIHNVAAGAQALALSALSSCRRRAAARNASAAVMPPAQVPVGSCPGSRFWKECGSDAARAIVRVTVRREGSIFPHPPLTCCVATGASTCRGRVGGVFCAFPWCPARYTCHRR
jgi:hypothetical protein